MDPFDVSNSDTTADANAGGGNVWDSPSFWKNLTAFGASTMAAANERTPQGFLKYGTGVAGPVGAGMLGAMEQNRQNAKLQSQIGLQGAQTGNLKQETIAKKIATAQGVGQYNALAPLYGTPQLDPQGNPIPGGGSPSQSLYSSPSVTPTAAQPQGQAASGQKLAGGSPAQGLVGGIQGIESGGNYAVTNKGGYSGAYQYGTAALHDANMYQPAQGEDLTKNQWLGQITVPGFQPMTQQQFLANPQAQDAAFQVTSQRNMQIAQQNGMTDYIGKTVGGVPITPASLVAGIHFGGMEGTAKFLATNGRYNPNDNPNDPAHGTYLSGYMGRVANIHQEIQGQQQAQASGASQQQAAQPQDTMTLVRGFLGGHLNNITPDQARQIAPLIGKIQPELGNQLWKYGSAALQAGQVSAAQGANQVPPGYQRTADGRMVAIPGGPADPGQIAQEAYAKGFDVRQGGMHHDPIMGWVRNPELVPTINTTPGPNYGAPGKVWATPPIIGGNGPGGQVAPGSSPTQQGATQPGGQAPSGQAAAPGNSPFAIGEGGQPLQTGLAPMAHEFQEKRGGDLAEQYQDIDTHAAAAIDGNYLIENMRRESQSWDMNRFAEWKGEGKAYLQAAAQSFGIATPDLDKSLADYQSFVKSTGQITRAAVHETSSRAAAQEYQMIQSTLPSPEMSSQAFSQIADQMQGVYDYNLAKQKFAHDYTGNPNDMNVAWNRSVTPSAFMLNRMTQTPVGQATLQTMLGNMSKTPEGRAVAARLQSEVRFAKTNGFFDSLGTEQQPQAQQ